MDSQPDRARETLALFLEVSQSFHALMGADALLPLITEKLGVLLDAEACSIILYDAERHELYFQVSSDDRLDSSARLKEIRFPASEGISGWVLREGQSVLVPDVSREPRFYHAVDRQLGTQSRSLICAPLRTRSGTLGVTQARCFGHASRAGVGGRSATRQARSSGIPVRRRLSHFQTERVRPEGPTRQPPSSSGAWAYSLILESPSSVVPRR